MRPINSGSRTNMGSKKAKNTFVEEAVYVGAVVARLEYESVMEYQDLVIGKNQSTITEGCRSETDGTI